MLNEQQRWNRYVHAINYCIGFGYYIEYEMTSTGNLKHIRVKQVDPPYKEAIIKMAPKKYKKNELLNIIVNHVGY
jgi:hypothetical protein